MTKTDMIYEIANRTKQTKTSVEKILGAFFDVTGEQLKKGEKVAIAGFGTFETSLRAARTGRNPATGEAMEISESKSVKFKASKTLKDKVK